MGPIALELYQRLRAQGDPESLKGARIVQEAAHFQVDEDFMDTCITIAATFPCTEFSDKLPARSVFLHVCGKNSADDIAFYLGPDMTLPDVVAMSIFSRTDAHGVGHWRPRTRMVGLLDTVRDRMRDLTEEQIKQSEEFREAYHLAEVLNTVCELLCEPRIVERNIMPRADRKRAARDMGGAALPTIWAQVRWNVGDTTRQKGARTGTGEGKGKGKAYHMVRAHWRNYGDRQTQNSEERPGRPGWWTWIDTHHSGNPAFGIVGHRYDPKLHPEKSASAISSLIASRTKP